MVQVTKVQNANRMMISIEPSRQGLNVSFADGLVSSVPWDSIREVHGVADVDSIELESPYEALVRTKRKAKWPRSTWDFARHFGDQEYRDQVDEIACAGAAQVCSPPAQVETGVGTVSAESGGAKRCWQSHYCQDRGLFPIPQAGHYPETGCRDGISGPSPDDGRLGGVQGWKLIW